MSLYSLIKEKDKYYTFNYLDSSDLAYPHNINKIIDLAPSISEYFKDYVFEINNTTFNDYLICYELLKYNKNLKSIANDEFKNFINSINIISKKFDQKNILDFLENNNVQTEKKLYHIFYEYLKNNKNLLTKKILSNNLPNLQYYFLKDYKNWIDMIIDFEIEGLILHDLENLINNSLESTLKLLRELKQKNIDINKYVKVLNKKMDDYLSNEEEKVLFADLKYRTILNYYKLMNLPEANIYEAKLDVIKDKVDKWMDVNGQSFSLDLQIHNVIEEIKQVKHNGLQIIYYTHHQVIDNNKRELISFYESAKRTSVSSRPVTYMLFQSASPESKTYDNWLQECYIMNEVLHLNILNYVFNDANMLKNYFEGIEFFISKITENYDNKNLIISKIKKLLDKMKSIIEDDNTNNLVYKDFCINCIQFIEFLSREIIYESKKSDEYVKKTSWTIGTMFDSSKSPLTKILNDDFLNGIKYYLSYEINEKGEKVGLDFRNRMSHGDEFPDESYDVSFFTRVSLIFTTLINELYLYSTNNK